MRPDVGVGSIEDRIADHLRASSSSSASPRLRERFGESKKTTDAAIEPQLRPSRASIYSRCLMWQKTRVDSAKLPVREFATGEEGPAVRLAIDVPPYEKDSEHRQGCLSQNNPECCLSRQTSRLRQRRVLSLECVLVRTI